MHIKDVWFIGRIAQGIGCLFVERKVKSSSDISVQIKNQVKYIQNNEDANQFMIFPEGITSKVGYIKKFKIGAFLSLSPIKPLYMEYRTPFAETCYYFSDLLFDLMVSLAQLYSTLNVVEMPTIMPMEGADAKNYAEDVYKLYMNEFNMEPVELDVVKRDVFLEKLLKSQ